MVHLRKLCQNRATGLENKVPKEFYMKLAVVLSGQRANLCFILPDFVTLLTV